jgi:hypothetical protein
VRRLIFISLFLCICVTACSPANPAASISGNPSGGAADSEASIPKADSPALIAIITRQACPAVDKEFAPIVVAILTTAITSFVPPLIESATSKLDNWLNDRANALNASTTALATWNLWAKSGDTYVVPARCLIFVRGDFSTKGNPPAVADVPNVWTAADTVQLNNLFAAENITSRLRGNPELYMEFAIDFDEIQPDPNVNRHFPLALKLRPVAVTYFKSGSKRGSDTQKKVVAELKLSAQSFQNGVRSQLVLVDQPFDFGQIHIGGSIDSGQLALQPVARAPMVYPFAEDLPAAVAGKPPKGGASKYYDPVSVTASVVVTESESGGDIERAFAKGIQNAAPGLEKAIEDALTKAVTPKKTITK